MSRCCRPPHANGSTGRRYAAWPAASAVRGPHFDGLTCLGTLVRRGSACVGAPRLKWVVHAHVNMGVYLNVYVRVRMTCTALVSSIDVVRSLVVRGTDPGLVHGRPENRPQHCVPPTRPRIPNFAASELGETSTSGARSKRFGGALGTLSAVPGQSLAEDLATWRADVAKTAGHCLLQKVSYNGLPSSS